MSSDMRSRSLKSYSRACLFAALGTGIVGLMLLSVKAINTAAHQWKPLEAPLPVETKGTVRATFVPDKSVIHEVVLEFDSVLPEAELRQLLEVDGDQTAADVSWTISSEGQVVAAGGSRVHLYYSTGGRTLLGRIKRYLLSIPFHRDKGSFVQVIGRAPFEARRPYEIMIDLLSLDPALANSSPRLGLKLSRELWTRHEKNTGAFALGGLAMLGISAALSIVWFGAVCIGWMRSRLQSN